MYLIHDIHSAMNPKKIYGRKGDRVTVKAYHGSVVTVEIRENSGFAVRSEEISLTKRA